VCADMEGLAICGRQGQVSGRAKLTGRNRSGSRGGGRRWYWLCGVLIALSSISPEAVSGPRWWDKHEWTKADTAFQLGYTALHIMDWSQTLDIESDSRYYERNSILGKDPSRGRVNTYFATTLGLHWLIARALPPKWRSTFQAGTIAIQFGVVKDNFEAGVSLDF
jgi:hypothetical protein